MAAKSVRYLGNLWIWEITPAYRREVEKVLHRMRTVSVGEHLIQLVSKSVKFVLISPFVPTEKSPYNAEAQARSWDAFPEGTVYTRKVKIGNAEFEFFAGIAAGGGSAVDLRFHPATWHEFVARKGRIPPGAGAGETLFHELVHARRMLKGLQASFQKVIGEDKMDNVDELCAIMGANVYRSQRGFTKLRKHHEDYVTLTGSLTDPENYYEHYKKYIDKWFSDDPVFCLGMAKARAKFNPFRYAAIDLKLMAEMDPVPMALP